MRRARHPEDFKREAVRLLLSRGERSIRDVAKSLDVSSTQLARWQKRYRPAVESPDEHARLTAEQVENRRLRKENETLRMEREILKKAAAFFAKESR
jgi:transposase